MSHKYFSPSTIAIALLFGIGFAGCGTERIVDNSNNTDSPNIIFIMADDHATQGFGVYGSRLARLNPTPVIDEFASEGMVFDNVFCNNSICTPSRASIMTGQYPLTNGVVDLRGRIPAEKQYLPMEMKKLGYQTAIIGKWHLKEEPVQFDYYKVLPGQGTYLDPVFIERGTKNWPDDTVRYKGHSTDVITDLALEWLKEKRDDGKPFFLMHHYKAPHDPFENARRYDEYLADIEIPEPASLYNQPYFGSEATRGKNDSLIHRIGTSVSARHPIRNYVQEYVLSASIDPSSRDQARLKKTSVDDWSARDKGLATHLAYQTYVKKFLRCVKGIDDNLKRLFDYLKESGLWENTIIIYTADQGFMLGEHDYIDKRWMYDESMRMPFIVHYPPMVKAGSRSDALISNVDFAPTLLELAGGKVPDYMQGKSFLPVLQGRELTNSYNSVYFRYWLHMVHHDIPSHFGIRTKDYKLIFFYGLPEKLSTLGQKSIRWEENSFTIQQTPAAWEFYDLRRDPQELHNRYGDPEYRKVIFDLKAQLKQKREELHETDENYPHIQKVIDEHWE